MTPSISLAVAGLSGVGFHRTSSVGLLLELVRLGGWSEDGSWGLKRVLEVLPGLLVCLSGFEIVLQL